MPAVRGCEWSDGELRHGRLSREGNGRESRAATEIQLYGGRPRALMPDRLGREPGRIKSVRARIGFVGGRIRGEA